MAAPGYQEASATRFLVPFWPGRLQAELGLAWRNVSLRLAAHRGRPHCTFMHPLGPGGSTLEAWDHGGG